MRLALKVVTHSGEDFVKIMLIECVLCSVPYLGSKRQYGVIMLNANKAQRFY